MQTLKIVRKRTVFKEFSFCVSDFHGKMAIYANPSNAQSFDSVSIDRDTTENGRVILDMDTNSEQSTKEKVNIFIIFTFILELLILIFVIVLEYFLR